MVPFKTCLAVSFLMLSSMSNGSPDVNRQLDSLTIIYANDDHITARTFSYDEFFPLVIYEVVAPHSSTNPDRATERWEGVKIIDVAEKAKVASKPDTSISIVGRNGYAVAMTLAEVARSEVIVAFRKNGESIDMAAGGPQSVFPIGRKGLDDKYLRESWWTWYATTVFIGDLPAIISTNLEGKAKLELANFSKITSSEMMQRYPIGKRELDAQRRPVATRYVSLDAFFSLAKFNDISIKTYLGDELTISNDFDKYALVFEYDGQVVPHALGGPVQLCHIESQQDCVFYVSELSFGTEK